MQTMSSPSMSDAADTPVSGSCGSPSPPSPLSMSKQILDYSKKDSSESDSANDVSPKTADNERSVNSSPATLVPTPRSTPPVNGILTPPNDIEGSSEPSKLGKPGGRLKFFKDGVLCLELTHHGGDGERTKWVQIRSKTVFPTLIHTVKEATIPCHSTPSSFASPSSLTHNHRVESSTSHSLSDDACSMLSSPRARESNWKQAVPQRGVSTCLQFYMKTAPCALKLRGKLKELSYSQDHKRKRWPYPYRGTDIFLKLKNSVQCCCDEQSRVLTDSSISVNNNNNDSKQNSSDEGDNGNDDVTPPKRKLTETAHSTKAVNKRKMSLHKMVEHLEKVAEAQSKLYRETKSSKTNGDVSDPGRKCSSVRSHAVTPKKRLFNEVEGKESNNIRPKKKSPNRAHDPGRTILNIPGLNSDFYKRHTPTKATKSLGHPPPSLVGVDMIDFSKSRKSGVGVELSTHKRSNRSPHIGAKTVSPGTNSSGGSTLKPGYTAELVDRFSQGGRNARLSDEHLSPRHPNASSDLQEQQYLQQQTVSKAISYTINSLLGSGSVANESGSSSSSPITKRLEYASSQKLPAEVLSPHTNPNFHGQRESKHNSPIRNSSASRPDQDQKSFLRHLLDTSDPIPSVKSGDRTSKNLSRAAPVSHPSSNSRNSNSVLKTSKPSSNHHSHHDAMASMNASVSKGVTGKSSASSHGPHHPAKDPMSEVHQNLATNIALQSLMSSLPFGVTSPYEILARGASANQHSTDALAAAAAALQYGSLIQGNPFANSTNSTMAAAMAASYFGMMPIPNFPISATPPSSSSGSQSSPPPSSKSNSNSSSSTIRKRQHELLNSNQRGTWQGMVNGGPHSHGTPSFRKASTATSTNSQHSLSPGRSSSSAISSVENPSCGALNLSAKKKNKVEEPSPVPEDLDAPLDLCKKSSR